ncbi:uncharacterized protein BT62DRAFT_925559 [Guyanagaster necrorhizus]|uniref:N-acetyltransferase ECO1 n=1 Tax=Guyanagaster necrorhizus TaxID=856835 RepID=A0A9P7W6T3_9AGAR|nr:uncharacterized protein BT62DRAFT_925559 [Guyanagaster necrorhizus MCA 3950]KAG7453015.1 hypothetical protein BT62DRAFT_925559 [Guyanagaster necrorhizus MCA 3950]
MPSNIKRTYSGRRNRVYPPSSPISGLSSSPAPTTSKKRPLQERSNISPPPAKRAKKEISKSTTQKSLTQLHFCIDQSILRTCSLCGLSYTKGVPDDESLHRAHCNRVRRGMEWGREERRENEKAGLVEVAGSVMLKDGTQGRIISVRADAGGKVGSKLSTLFDTINITLSSPALTREALQASRAFLFLVPASKVASAREKIVGCAIAQRISTAMAIAEPDVNAEPTNSPTSTNTDSLIVVDTDTGIFCHPEPLPTPLGIPRLFVSQAHRRQGIASKLLSAAARTSIQGCVLDPRKGHVAFTQPTGDGNSVMRKWGGGGVRIYVE